MALGGRRAKGPGRRKTPRPGTKPPPVGCVGLRARGGRPGLWPRPWQGRGRAVAEGPPPHLPGSPPSSSFSSSTDRRSRCPPGAGASASHTPAVSAPAEEQGLFRQVAAAPRQRGGRPSGATGFRGAATAGSQWRRRRRRRCSRPRWSRRRARRPGAPRSRSPRACGWRRRGARRGGRRRGRRRRRGPGRWRRSRWTTTTLPRRAGPGRRGRGCWRRTVGKPTRRRGRAARGCWPSRWTWGNRRR